MRRIFPFAVSVILALVFSTEVNAQRDAPVWSCYLSPISILDKHPLISTQFVLHKDGGPHEHFEHQCYILLYLKTDEDEILKSIVDEAFVDKKKQAEHSFLVSLEEKGMVVRLATKVARRMLREKGKEQQCTSGFCYPFEFDFSISDLFKKLNSVKNFDANDVKVSGKSTWFNQKFGLIAFVPVNDSIYSTDVADELQQTHDFANIMDSNTSILYFRPLPYEFSFKRHEEKVILYIN
ncbi:MAG TPA: hypothetical protein DDW52_18210 [Planctomycetaceae bacterium]|nr:hypothetical protein [Planctomycetaceae bacterium]